jgi:hypothetical protein
VVNFGAFYLIHNILEKCWEGPFAFPRIKGIE